MGNKDNYSNDKHSITDIQKNPETEGNVPKLL